MRTTRRAGAALLTALLVLLTAASIPAEALTLQRTWTARMGSSGTNGAIRMRAYTDGSGSISYALKGLRANATYSVSIRKGTCSKLGTIVARPTSVRTSTTGTVARTNPLLDMQMHYIWTAARSPSFVVRLVSGTSNRCGPFTFPHATRVTVSSVGINLPVIRGTSSYPKCGVAMYLPEVAQPREPGITFLYAHARRGMFLPLLTRWKVDRGASLIGKTVKVYTSDSYVISYRINKVRVTSKPMTGVRTLATSRLWLQTSTGPNTTYPKLIVEGYRISTLKTTYAASHPTPHPYSC
ncbi:MAG TPA: sortase [Candidatus Limnocylindrales bacterium]|nr:sortase [Candidatus Limnocylindrales bacterium]